MNITHKLRSRRGFTLSELLVTMVMMAMASAVISQALTFAYRAYLARTGDIEAQLLCETVSMLVQDDLTKQSNNDNTPSYHNVEISETTNIDDVTLNKAAFGYGARKVTVSVLTVSPDDGLYHVTVSVSNRNLTVSTNEFTVRPLG